LNTAEDALTLHYRSELGTVVSRRPWIVAMDVLAQATDVAKKLLDLGAPDVLALGVSRGTGDLPPESEVTQIDLGHTSRGDFLTAIREGDDLLSDLPAHARHTLDTFDPGHEAGVISNIFSSGRPVGDRPVWGARPLSWQALEDKMIIDAFFDEAGIRRASSTLVPVELDALRTAHHMLDEGLGTIWVGDNRTGWHGGASMLRWVRTEVQQESACAFLGEHCDQVRVMPFLEGLPCSIHGWVFPDDVIALRPCEMLVLRQPESSELCYAGSSTNWLPTDPVRTAMHEAAIRAGKHMSRTVGYRGSFTLDGVVTPHGFLPTEINPRFGGALGRMSQSLPYLPLYLLHLATAEGLKLDYRPRELERMIVDAVDRSPTAKGMQMLKGQFDLEPRKHPIRPDGEGGYRWAEQEEDGCGFISLGPATFGSVVFVKLDQGAIPDGASFAPYLCRALTLADQDWDLGIGPLLPAPDTRVEEDPS